MVSFFGSERRESYGGYKRREWKSEEGVCWGVSQGGVVLGGTEVGGGEAEKTTSEEQKVAS